MFQQIDSPREPQPQDSAEHRRIHDGEHSMEQSVWAHVQHTPLASMWDLQGVPVKEVAKRVWNGIDEDSLFGRASQLAYSFFAAIFPALIAMAALMGIVAKSSGKLYFELLGRIGQLIPPSAFELVTETFQKTTSASTPGKLTFGVAFALFSASVGLSAVQDTLNAIYRVKETRPFWKARLEAIGLTVLVALIVIAALLTLFGGDYVGNHLEHLFRGSYVLSLLVRFVGWVLASLLMVLSFEVMYFLCPDVPHRKWRWFTPGGLLGLLGWVAGSLALRVYLHYFNNYSVTYGTLGGDHPTAVVLPDGRHDPAGRRGELAGGARRGREAAKKAGSAPCPLPPQLRASTCRLS